MSINVETKKTVTIVDKATKALSKVTADATKIMTDLSALTSLSDVLATDIEMKAHELEGIESSMATRLRDAEADLAIQVKENAERVMQDLMAGRNLAYITNQDLRNLKDRVNTDEFDNSAAIETAVKAAERSAHAAAAISQSKLEAAHAVASAKLEADNSALQAKIEFLVQSNESLQQSIADERTARVEMSRNASQPTINVGTSKN